MFFNSLHACCIFFSSILTLSVEKSSLTIRLIRIQIVIAETNTNTRNIIDIIIATVTIDIVGSIIFIFSVSHDCPKSVSYRTKINFF